MTAHNHAPNPSWPPPEGGPSRPPLALAPPLQMLPPPPIPPRDPRSLFVHDTFVRRVRPWRAGVLCALTLGVTGAVRHFRMNDELRRLGRARGGMPFAFIPCNPGWAVTWWCFGVLLWILGAAVIVGAIVDPFTSGGSWSVEIVPTVATSLLLFAPLWMTTLHTARRIRTAQRLTAVEPAELIPPYRAAVIACCHFALFSWYAQRHLDRAWQTWEGAPPAHPIAPIQQVAAVDGAR